MLVYPKLTVLKNVQNGQLRKLDLAKTGFGSLKSVDVERRNQLLNVRFH